MINMSISSCASVRDLHRDIGRMCGIREEFRHALDRLETARVVSEANRLCALARRVLGESA